MQESLEFYIGNEAFSVLSLVDQTYDNSEVQRFIQSMRDLDESYMFEEPLPEDIDSPQSHWSCHIADGIGVSFELVSGKICYLSFNKEKFQLLPTKGDSDSLIWFETRWIKTDTIVFLSKNSLEKKMLPNRFVPLLVDYNL